MAEAVQLSCQFMELAITTDNCVDILNLAELYVLTDSRVKVRTYILEHFETFAESAQYFKLNHSQLASLLDQNSLKVGCNDVVVTGQYLSGIFSVIVICSVTWVTRGRIPTFLHLISFMRDDFFALRTDPKTPQLLSCVGRFMHDELFAFTRTSVPTTLHI